MSKKQLVDALRDAVDPNVKAFSLACTVDSVDLTNLTCYCVPINGDADMQEVKLIANNNKGFLIVPAVDSVVIVSLLSGSSYYVSMFSKVDSIQLNGDSYGGIPRVDPLVTKVNALENLLNNVLNVLKTTSIPLAPSGTYPFAPLYAALSNIAPLTQKSDLENTTVKHGNGS